MDFPFRFVLFCNHPGLRAAARNGRKENARRDRSCVKCALKESDTCQTALQVEENGKKTTYYMEQNNVSKLFHEAICKEPKKVRVTGRVREVNGKNEMTAGRIELID
jgi:hypothetical protein